MPIVNKSAEQETRDPPSIYEDGTGMQGYDSRGRLVSEVSSQEDQCSKQSWRWPVSFPRIYLPTLVPKDSQGILVPMGLTIPARG